MRIGLLHPGEMGAAVGGALVDRGHEVLWIPAGRSAATRDRAASAGLTAAEDNADLAARCALVISICPPDAALDVARSVPGDGGLFLDANAISPARSRTIAGAIARRYVDGSIIGPPPTRAGTTRLYLSGPGAEEVAEIFAGARIEPRVLAGDDPTAASALKMTYAAWTKGSAALLIAIAEAAETLGVGEALAAEWADSSPELTARLAGARRSAAAKGWRWEAEMREIAATLSGAGEPAGFHEAAAEVFGRSPRPTGSGSVPERPD